MDSKLAKFWNEHRLNRRIRLKRRHTRRHIPRPKRDAKELAYYLRTNFITTTGELRKARSATDPTVGDIVRCFGSWREGIRQAHGEPKPKIQIATSRANLIDVVMLLKIGTLAEYHRQHREQPSAVPSWYFTKRFFPTFGSLMTEVYGRSADLALERYRALQRKLGNKTPSAEDCRVWQVDLTPLRKGFGNKRKMDNLLGGHG